MKGAPTVVVYLRVPVEVRDGLQRLALRAFKNGRRADNGQKPSIQSEGTRLLAAAVTAELAKGDADPDQLDMFATAPAAAVAQEEAELEAEAEAASKHRETAGEQPKPGRSLSPTAARRPGSIPVDRAPGSISRRAAKRDGLAAAVTPAPDVREAREGNIVTIQWSPTTTRVARFVRWTKSGANAVVCIQRVTAKGTPLAGQFGEPRTVPAADVVAIVGRRVRA